MWIMVKFWLNGYEYLDDIVKIPKHIYEQYLNPLVIQDSDELESSVDKYIKTTLKTEIDIYETMGIEDITWIEIDTPSINDLVNSRKEIKLKETLYSLREKRFKNYIKEGVND